MKKHCKHIVTIVRRSCLTNKVVWIYRGASAGSARHAYLKACKKEIKRVRMWMQDVNERRRSLMQFINQCMASLPLTAEMTPEQKDAAKELRRIEKDEQPCHREFYDHVIEEVCRRNEASGRWRE